MKLPFYHSPYFLLCLANLFWSLNFIIGKLVGTAVPPVTISFFRWGVPLAFYLVFCWRDILANQAVYRRHWRLLAVLGLTGYCLNSITVYYAVLSTSVINTSFINAFNPVLIALAGWGVYRYPLTVRQVLGFLLSFVGVVWIVFKGDIGAVLGLRINTGDLIMLSNIGVWTVHTILYKRYSGLFSPQSLFAVMMLAGVAATVPLLVLENLHTGLGWTHQVALRHLVGLLALSLFPSVLAYRFWNQALNQISANKAAISQYLIPVYTVLISVAFLGDALQGFQLLGGALIFVGVLLVVMPSQG